MVDYDCAKFYHFRITISGNVEGGFFRCGVPSESIQNHDEILGIRGYEAQIKTMEYFKFVKKSLPERVNCHKRKNI